MKIKRFNEDVEYSDNDDQSTDGFLLVRNHNYEEYFFDISDIDGWKVDIYEKNNLYMVSVSSPEINNWFYTLCEGRARLDYFDREIKSIEYKKLVNGCISKLIEIENLSICSISAVRGMGSSSIYFILK